MRGGCGGRRLPINDFVNWAKTVLYTQLIDSGDSVCELFCHKGSEVCGVETFQYDFFSVSHFQLDTFRLMESILLHNKIDAVVASVDAFANNVRDEIV